MPARPEPSSSRPAGAAPPAGSEPGEQKTALDASADEASTWPPLPQLGSYVLEQQVGAGGMGIVYRAWEPALARAVALKLIAPARARDARTRELFIRESLVAAGLEHPHVVPIYGAGEQDGQLFLAMRYVEGDSLARLIARRGCLPPTQATRILAQVADALDAAHAHDLVHRDVKPANVLIAGEEGAEHAYLTDFGLATLSTVQSGGGGWAGTLGYLAPEQIRGRALDARTDVYALGCLLHHALTGRPPFEGARDQVLVAHLVEPPPHPSGMCPWLPASFDPVVARALAKRPADRFSSAGALARAARAALDDAFLAHSPDERARAEGLAQALRAAGLDPWVETWRGSPDGDADHEQTEGLRGARALLLLIGADGLGGWSRETLLLSERLAEQQGLRQIACLLAGAPDAYDPRLAYLADFTFVDLRAEPPGPAVLHELARAVRGEPATGMLAAAPGVCPYRGLEAFEQQHSEFFVGREEEVARAGDRLRAARFLALLGASGSGKSSLLRAGILPALQSGGLPGGEPAAIALLTPGRRPVEALAAALEGCAITLDPATLLADERALDQAAERADRGSGPVVVAVDQLEEAFTLCTEPAERRAFLRALRHAAAIPAGRAVVVVAMRADFYGRLAEEPRFAALVEAAQLLVGPLGPDRLARVLADPARRAGLTLEEGLPERILSDVAERPGALPLLSYLLLELWRRRRAATLTNEAYASAGGVEGALARRAGGLYQALSPAAQTRCRRLLLRLVQPGEQGEDTRRRADRAELAAVVGGDEHLTPLLEALSGARLVSVGRDAASGQTVVDLAHEALIRAWPELRGWIEEERETLRLERRLGEAAGEWERSGREEGALYRGARLAAWEGSELRTLAARDRVFLEASRRRAIRDRQVRRRRIRLSVAGLVLALAAISAVAGVAIKRGGDAARQRDVAQSRDIAASANAQLGGDPELGLLLAIRAYETSPTSEAEEVLRQATHDSTLRQLLPVGTTGSSMAFSPQNDRLLTWGDAAGLRVWDLRTGREAVAPARSAALFRRPGAFAAAFSRDGREIVVLRGPSPGHPTLPTRGPAAPVTVWDAGTGRFVRTVGVQDNWRPGTLSPDGRLIVGGGPARRDASQRLHVLEWETGREVGTIAVSRGAGGNDAISGDGRRYGVCGSDGELRLWRIGRPGPPAVAGRCAGHALALDEAGDELAAADDDATLRLTPLDASAPPPRVLRKPGGTFRVGFGLDGRVAVTSGDGTVTLLDPGSGATTVLRGHHGESEGLAWSADGRLLASSGLDGTIRIWDVSREPQILGDGRIGFVGAALDGQGDLLAAGDEGGDISVWRLTNTDSPLRVLRNPGVENIAFSRGGDLIASTAADGELRLWDWRGTATARSFGPMGTEGSHPVALSPDAELVAAAGDCDTPTSPSWTRLWHVDGRRLESLPPGLRGRCVEGTDAVSLAFTPDGSQLVEGSVSGGGVYIWPLSASGAPVRLAAGGGAEYGVDVSADGRYVAGSGSDGTIRVWELASRRALVVLSGHQDSANSVRFSRDGRLLVSAGQDGTVRVWDWRRAHPVLVLRGHTGTVWAAEFTPDAQHVVSASRDGTIRVWNCDVCGPMAEVLMLARRRAVRALTAEERRTFLHEGESGG